MLQNSRNLDRTVSAMAIGAGSDFRSSVILGFTSCGMFIITYSISNDEMQLKVWQPVPQIVPATRLCSLA